MNIGIVTTWFERGAAYVSRQYRDLLKDDFKVFIYARGGEQCAIDDPFWDNGMVTWAQKSSRPVPDPIDKNDFTQWIKSKNIEIVFFNEQLWWIPVLWCKDIGIKIGAYVDYYTEETIPLFSAYDFLICNTRRHFEAFAWHSGAHYIPWGTDTELFRPSSVSRADDGIVTFFHSAGMNPKRKGTDLVLEAFAELKGNKKLIIHSQVSIKDRLPKQLKLFDNLMNNNEISIIEATVSAPGLYHLGDVYVYPTRLEGIGLTICEAISCGLPVIVPDNPPMNEFVVDGSSGKKVAIRRLYARPDGYYWPQCEIILSSLAEQMQWYINRSDQLTDYKTQARQYALINLDWGKNRTKVIEIFANIAPRYDYDSDLIISYETKRSKSHWLSSIYMKSPALYGLLYCGWQIKGLLSEYTGTTKCR